MERSERTLLEPDEQERSGLPRGTEAVVRIAEPVFIGRSASVLDLQGKINIIAQSGVPVLLTGESGTGKEVVARLIHSRGFGSGRPFIAINSAALPKDVVDNELFGHEKEAFTGAVSKKPGCFELAHQGSLFLDEIAEMHPQTQSKLLRAIENKRFRRLGGKEEVGVDVRVIAATNKDVHSALKDGSFREDLYYRLSVFEINLPPLRERPEDIDLLLNHFCVLLCQKYSRAEKTFSADALEHLRSYPWPGNVRELRNIVERAVLTSSSDIITNNDLPSKISSKTDSKTGVTIHVGVTLEEASRMFIARTLAAVDNNKSQAARILGLTRKTLRTKLAGR